MPPMFVLRFVLAVLAMLLMPQTAVAEYPPQVCSCKNLESLQQDYQNAVYLEGFFRKLSNELKVSEASDLAKGISRDVIDAYGDQYYADVIRIVVKQPFPTVLGYTGPEELPMIRGTCEQDPALLEKMAKGSPCNGIADAALLHEFEHRELCKKLGADVYWDRFSSEFAADEADRYKAQAANLKAELRQVLEAAKIELIGEWHFSADAQGMMTSDHEHLTQSTDIGGATKGDNWTMSGKGESSNSIVTMTIMGKSCTTSGSIRNAFDVAMTTDGLTFGLEIVSRRTEGDVAVKCGGGGGMSMPTNDSYIGVIATGQPLVVGENPLDPDWVDDIKAMMAGSGLTISGEPNTRLSVTCEAP